MLKDGIAHLLKFVPKEAYIDDLINGRLYMNAAGYYHGLPGEQGDPLEASMAPGVCLYGYTCLPIYLHVHGPRERYRRQRRENPDAHDPGVRVRGRVDRYCAVRQLRTPRRQTHCRRRKRLRPRSHLLRRPRAKTDSRDL